MSARATVPQCVRAHGPLQKCASMQCGLTLNQTTCTHIKTAMILGRCLSMYRNASGIKVLACSTPERQITTICSQGENSRCQARRLTSTIFLSLQLISIFLIICLWGLKTKQNKKSTIQWKCLCPQRFLPVQAFHLGCQNPSL